MLLPTTTWGQLREIALRDLKSSSESSDNLLARDPDLLEKGADKKDADYVWPKEAKLFLESMGEEEEEDPEPVTASATSQVDPGQRQKELLQELASLHSEWYDDVQADVELNEADQDPHDKETMESDYMLHYPDRSSTPEQEKVFQDKVARIHAELQALSKQPGAVTAAGAPGEEEHESPLFFTVDDDGNVLELIKDEDDSLSIRIDGEWVDISDEDEFPTVYEQILKPATDDSVGAWDADLEDNQELKLEDIADYIVE